MVGGAEEEFTAARELLSCMGTNVVYCGQVGTGQVRTRTLLCQYLVMGGGGCSAVGASLSVRYRCVISVFVPQPCICSFSLGSEDLQ